MASIVSLALAFIVAVASADGKTTTCYGYNGEPFENNTVCPGSNACCGAQATCLSNRLCHNPNDGPNTFVRGPCSVESYDSGTCAQICLYNEEGGAFPRVVVCADGTLCCDKDPHCCADGKGRFLDNEGKIAGEAPSTTYSWGPERTEPGFHTDIASSTPAASTTVASSRAAVTSTSPELEETTSAEASDDDKAEDNKDDGNSLKIGLGVGLPVGFIALGLAAFWFFWRRRRAAQQASTGQDGGVAESNEPKTYYGGHQESQEVSELDSSGHNNRNSHYEMVG